MKEYKVIGFYDDVEEFEKEITKAANERFTIVPHTLDVDSDGVCLVIMERDKL